MPFFSKKEVLNLKLRSVDLARLKILARQLGLSPKGTSSKIIKQIIESGVDEGEIDYFIKQQYKSKIKKRRSIVADEVLKRELGKVKSFSWGIVQGQLDQKIQAEYVRKIVSYDDLL